MLTHVTNFSMWIRGPPLIATLKDTSLHQSLRLPAFDLFQIILVSDASALAALSGKLESPESLWGHLLENGVDDGLGAESSKSDDSLVGDNKYWNSFKKVSDSVGEGVENWSCVPLLWIEALKGAFLPSPVSFCKAVLWALGRLAMVDPPAGPPSGKQNSVTSVFSMWIKVKWLYCVHSQLHKQLWHWIRSGIVSSH